LDASAAAPESRFFDYEVTDVEFIYGGLDDEMVWVFRASSSLTVDLGAGRDSVFFSSGSTNQQGTTPKGTFDTHVEIRNVESFHGGSDTNDYVVVIDPAATGVSASGSSGHDEILGAAGSDALSGNAGDDVLHGGGGNDRLGGGPGADDLYGDAGNDTFTFGYGGSSASPADTIWDFQDGADRIDLSRHGIDLLNQDLITFSFLGYDAPLTGATAEISVHIDVAANVTQVLLNWGIGFGGVLGNVYQDMIKLPGQITTLDAGDFLL
jgi:Ca2+-binding RTX toxin-like protein